MKTMTEQGIKKKENTYHAIRIIVFIIIFLLISSVLTPIFKPNWIGYDAEQMRGLFAEEEDSLDVLFLGSCNMYSSFSPVMSYDEYGIASYVFGCPDQEIATSYHYLKEALKTQKNIKVVVLEALFLTNPPSPKREYYNRLALDYFPMSKNKLDLVRVLGKKEAEFMPTVDPSAPGLFFTYASYLYPLFRYHSRDDLTEEDVTFLWERDDYQEYKGGIPLYNTIKRDSLDFEETGNGDKIRDFSREYFIKLQKLCKDNDIQFMLLRSPNKYRWDETSQKVVEDFAKEMDVDFLDMQKEDFRLKEFSNTTGRLNIYGMKKLTRIVSEHLLENYDIPTYNLTEENDKKWQKCIDNLHAKARRYNVDIDNGQLGYIDNAETGIHLRWNTALDCDSYSLWKKSDNELDYTKLGDVTGSDYIDTDVANTQKYHYYIVPNEGELKGVQSKKRSYIFVEPPETLTAENKGDSVDLNWTPVAGVDKYSVQRRSWDTLNFFEIDRTDQTSCAHTENAKSTVLYKYRVKSVISDGEDNYYSASATAKAMPITRPAITAVYTTPYTIKIDWPYYDVTYYEIYRKKEGEESFKFYDSVHKQSLYYDYNVEPGEQYFYKIYITRQKLGDVYRSQPSNIVSAYARKIENEDDAEE